MEIIALVGVFLILGFIMAKFVLIFVPERHQYAWFVYSVWGIAWVVTSVFVVALWTNQTSLLWLYTALWATFLAALPGMIYLNWVQWHRWRNDDPQTIQDDLVEVLQRLVDGQDSQIRAIKNMLWTVLGPDVAEAFTKSVEELDKEENENE